MKLLIIGYARHGKDTAAKILASLLNLKFASSSEYACEKIVYPQLKLTHGYKTPAECFSDRASCRGEWYTIISNYNANDPTRMAKEIMKTNHMYVGMRSAIELTACMQAGVFDLIIWIDASKRITQSEGCDSCTVSSWMADVVIDNNTSVEEFKDRLGAIAKDMISPQR